MKTPKQLLENYDKPTPVKWRRVGDLLILISMVVTLFVPGLKWAIAIGFIGKFLTNTKT